MRLLILVLMLAAFLPSCSSHPTGHEPETEPGRLLVYIFSTEGQGSSEKRVELLETGDVAVTDPTGIVEFHAEPGDYTVRAFDVGTPGPPRPFVDQTTVVRSGQITRVEIYDCLYCRGARRS